MLRGIFRIAISWSLRIKKTSDIKIDCQSLSLDIVHKPLRVLSSPKSGLDGWPINEAVLTFKRLCGNPDSLSFHVKIVATLYTFKTALQTGVHVVHKYKMHTVRKSCFDFSCFE